MPCPQYWKYWHMLLHPVFTWVLGALMLVWQAHCQLSHLPSHFHFSVSLSLFASFHNGGDRPQTSYVLGKCLPWSYISSLLFTRNMQIFTNHAAVFIWYQYYSTQLAKDPKGGKVCHNKDRLHLVLFIGFTQKYQKVKGERLKSLHNYPQVSVVHTKFSCHHYFWLS